MKKTLRKAGRSLAVSLIVLGIYSCQQEELIETSQIQQTENFIDLNEVTAIAAILEFPVVTDLKSANVRSSGVSTTLKNIEAILEVPDENGDVSFYIVNYQDGGFIMVSADNRLEPIRAFSYDKKFPFQSDGFSSGLVSWLSQTSDMVYEARLLNQDQTLAVAQTWHISEMQATLAFIPPDDGGGSGGGGGSGCQDSYESVGPIMTTEWGQWDGFNNFVGIAGSCPTNSNTRPPTGCVATAMAQVMNHHHFPNHYNWAAMPDIEGSTETAILMDDIGEAVNMEYSCGSSGAYINDASAAFVNDFGYQNVSYVGFNRDRVISEIRSNRPVILSGYMTENKKCFLGWCSYSRSDGHAWVTDGFRKSKICNYNDYGNLYSTSVYYFLYMNWGWGGSQNAFYRWDDWSPGNLNFQYKKEMITIMR